jgi:hypothetical protein
MQKGLFVLYVWKFTGDEIGIQHPGKLKLPPYCIRQDNGKLEYTEYYLQFGAQGKDEYILFEMEPADYLLEEQISQGGIEEIFKDINLNELFKNFNMNRCNDRYIPTANYLTVDIIFEKCTSLEGTEYDMHYGEIKHIII